MKNDIIHIEEYVKTIVNDPGMVKLLSRSTYKMLELENIFVKDFSKNKKSGLFINNSVKKSAEEYFKKNIYSILLISLFDVLDISDDRGKYYLKIVNTLRAVLSTADIHDKDKSKLFAFGYEKAVDIGMLSMMYLINSQILIEDYLKMISKNIENYKKAESEIYNSIYAIIYAKYLRKSFYEMEYPAPDYIIKKIHGPIGGNVFKISFIPVFINEENLKIKNEEFLGAVNNFGTTLKILDDISRYKTDMKNGRLNIFHSAIIHFKLDGNIGFNELKEQFLNTGSDARVQYKNTMKYLCNMVIKNIQESLAVLSETIYPVKSDDILMIIKYLFEIKGLGSYIVDNI